VKSSADKKSHRGYKEKQKEVSRIKIATGEKKGKRTKEGKNLLTLRKKGP